MPGATLGRSISGCGGAQGLRPEQEEWRDFLIASGARWYLWRPSQVDAVIELLR